MSLFNRPTWAKSQSATTESDERETNIFSHSSRSYREIVAEQERKKQAKLEKKKKEKEERRHSGKREVQLNEEAAVASKRRRISLPEDEEESVIFDCASTEREEDGDVDVDNPPSENPAGRGTPRKNRHLDTENGVPSWNQRPNTQVVDLGDSDDEEAQPIPEQQPSTVDLVEDESDDEFATLARRAREQRQQQEYLGKKSQTLDMSRGPTSPGTGTSDTARATPPPDPTVQLLISSSIEGTNPMIVYRKLSQNIGTVRMIWCERQGFSEEATKDIFFIHRMRRVYDVTTCRSLGLEVDSLGNVTLKGARGQEDVEKVHLEAVTEELFRRMKAEKTQEAQKRSDTQAGLEDDSEVAEAPQEQAFIRLVLKARDRKDFKLKVKPTTTFARIAAAYVKTHLSDSQSASLEFDGERLNPDDEVQSTEVSDLDCIDVHISSR